MKSDISTTKSRSIGKLARLIDALHSRFANVDFTLTSEEKAKMASQFMKRMGQILSIEGIPYEKPVLAKIIERHFQIIDVQFMNSNGFLLLELLTLAFLIKWMM